MQFQNTWDSQFNKIVQGMKTCDNSLYHSQLNNESKNKPRGLFIRRQQYRTANVQEIANNFDYYTPLSDLIDWNHFKSKETVFIKKYRQSVYFGEFTEGKKTGLGIMVYTNGRVYEGEWIDNCKHGNGYEKFPNGSTYSGTYVNGKPEGYGTYSWENGQTYQGQLLDGLKNGSGIWRGPTGDSYIGEWSNGLANGYGVHTAANGDRFQGQFKDCLKHGQGLQKFSNGDQYKGLYVMGKPQGYGEYYWSIGSFYKGYFKGGMREGKGVWKRGNGDTDKYEGEYKQDKKQGYGVFTWQNGNVYKGNYVNDMRNGYGQMYWGDGRVYKGEWVNNQKVGQNEQFFEQNAYFIDEPPKQFQISQIVGSNGLKSKPSMKRKQKQQIVNSPPVFQYHPGYIQEPYLPEKLQRKFRARQILPRKQIRANSQKSKRSNVVHNNSVTQYNSNFMRKYSVGSRCDDTRKVKPGGSEPKVMSSTFYLYKIHSQHPNLDQGYSKPKPRQVKTSGGIRQKQISEQIKYFTKTKINPELY